MMRANFYIVVWGVQILSYIPAFKVNAQIIAGGLYHSLYVCNDSTVRAWGYNSAGELGDSTFVNSTYAIHVKYLQKIVAVAVGGERSLALKNDGTVWAWGNNSLGQLGDCTRVSKSYPVQVHGPNNIGFMSGVRAIACAENHSLALKNDSTVWAWGDNSSGQLGDSAVTFGGIAIPVKVKSLSGVIAIAANSGSSYAIKHDGTVWAWGDNSIGELGNGSVYHTGCYCDSVPRKIPGLSGINSIASGEGTHVLALKNDSTLLAWGNNIEGQIGDSSLSSTILLPSQVHGPNNIGFLTGIKSIAFGEAQSIALKSDGTVWAWGWNNSGQLGDGTTTNRYVPVQSGTLTNIVSIAEGNDFSFAIRNDGTIWGFGDNWDGQLGDGAINQIQSTPVQVWGPCNISAGIDYMNEANIQASVIPNPVIDKGKIVLSNIMENEQYRIEVYNELGIKEVESVFNDNHFDIEKVQFNSPGMYFFKVMNNKGKILTVGKFII